MPLLAAIAWSIAALGGTRVVDMVIVTGLVVWAVALSPSSLREGGRALLRSPPAMGVLVVLAWTSLVGLSTAGPGLAMIRLPWLLALIALMAATASLLTEEQRTVAAVGFVAIGVVLALSAILEWVGLAWGGEALPIRASTLLGYPNGAGVLLVATASTSVSLHRRAGLTTFWLGVLLGVQALGVLATGSRLALVATIVALALLAWRRRSLVAVGLAAAAAAPFVAVLVHRFATSRPERIDLWRAGLTEITAHPIVGRGPAPELVLSPLAGGKPTTHAHNELIQLTVEYGLVGLALTLLVLVLVMGVLAGRRLHDPWLAYGCLAIGMLAFTDFALRIPAVSLALALLVPLAWCRERPAPRSLDPGVSPPEEVADGHAAGPARADRPRQAASGGNTAGDTVVTGTTRFRNRGLR